MTDDFDAVPGTNAAAQRAGAPAAMSGTKRLTAGALSKVPEITVMFWITKVLTTGMGETTSDFLVKAIDPPVAVAAAGLLFAVVLCVQVRASRYIPWLYWLTVVLVSVFGTMAADVLHVGFGVPYQVSTIGFALALLVIFVVWYRSEGTLSIHDIRSPRREAFYWCAVLATFALGTAAGDLTAKVLNFGYLGSGLMFAGLIAIPAVGYWLFGLNATFAFWCAYVITRPLGASFADWIAVPPARGGLDWGSGSVSVLLSVAIMGCIVALARSWARVTKARQRPVA